MRRVLYFFRYDATVVLEGEGCGRMGGGAWGKERDNRKRRGGRRKVRKRYRKKKRGKGREEAQRSRKEERMERVSGDRRGKEKREGMLEVEKAKK